MSEAKRARIEGSNDNAPQPETSKSSVEDELAYLKELLALKDGEIQRNKDELQRKDVEILQKNEELKKKDEEVISRSTAALEAESVVSRRKYDCIADVVNEWNPTCKDIMAKNAKLLLTMDSFEFDISAMVEKRGMKHNWFMALNVDCRNTKELPENWIAHVDMQFNLQLQVEREYHKDVKKTVKVGFSARQHSIKPVHIHMWDEVENKNNGFLKDGRLRLMIFVKWIMTEMATCAYSNVIVPLYETLGPDACAFIIKESGMRIIVCDFCQASHLATFKRIITIRSCEVRKKEAEMLTPARNATASRCSSALVPVAVLEFVLRCLARGSGGSANPTWTRCGNVKDGQLLSFLFHDATIVYKGVRRGARLSRNGPMIGFRHQKADGTEPLVWTKYYEGVMLTHGNVIADATTLLYFKQSRIFDTEVMISFLPLAHMLERLVEAVCCMVGARAGFCRGDIRGLANDIREFRPTVLPRVLNRLYDKLVHVDWNATLNFFHRDPFLSDATLLVGNYRYHINKMYLAQYSGFFKRMFCGRFDDEVNGEIPLKVESSEHFENFLRCLYPEQKKVTENDLRAFIPMADYFEVPKLMDECGELLLEAQTIAFSECLFLANKYNLHLAQIRLCEQLNKQDEIQKVKNSSFYEAYPEDLKKFILKKMVKLDE